ARLVRTHAVPGSIGPEDSSADHGGIITRARTRSITDRRDASVVRHDAESQDLKETSMSSRVSRMIWLALAVLILASTRAANGQPTGGVARIGVLISGPRATYGTNAFQEGLAERGWVEGRNLTIEARFSDDRAEERLTALAEELVRARVQVIFAAN